LLWEMSTIGDTSKVRELLALEDIDVNWADEERNRTPLYRACGHGRLEVVKLLLADPRVDVNKGNLNNASPFYIACQEGHFEIFKVLLEDSRVDLNQSTRENTTPFYVCCKKGHLEFVKMLLEEKKVDIQKGNDNGATPCYIACQYGHVKILKRILLSEKKVNLKQKAKITGKTPLQQAIYMKDFRALNDQEDVKQRQANCSKIVQLLQKHEIDPSYLKNRMAAKIFTCIVSICDDYYTLEPSLEPLKKKRKRD